ncbi:MAG TPA: cytochrome c biogenesis protein CcdA [Candidatus Nanopelagicaceae bacterium]|jgi:cytochrome c biogenesis protein CcdA
MGQILFSTTILASFLGGVVALFAPCCVSVMLPAYFASTFRRRSYIVAMTLVFAAGVATIILPIALGAAIVSRALLDYHLWIFSIVGLVMFTVGIITLIGWKMMLPMPSRKGGHSGIGAVYGMGVFSGASSACCAPVLAGVVALSGAASSLTASVTVGLAYVFGMVAPLALLAIVWDRRDWGNSALLSARTVPIWPGAKKRIPWVTSVSGYLMIAMGLLTIVLALRGPGMAANGWQVEVTAALGHASAVIQRFLSFAPGWIYSLAIFSGLAFLVWKAVRHQENELQK